MKTYPFISVVIPVKNGQELIKQCLNSLNQLNYPKNRLEIIIADGRSQDQTKKISLSLGAKVIDNPKSLVVSGRNLGFKVAKGSLIAFSDVDCTFDKNWLKNTLKYFENPKVGGVSGPNLIPEYERPFGKAVGLIFNIAFFFNAGSPTSQHQKIIKSRSHGSNAIYRYQALKKAMPVDEGMVEGEDVLMTESIVKAGYRLLYVPDVIVTHFRRSTPNRWFNQMMRYAQAKILLKRKRVKKITPTQNLVGLFLPFLVLILLFSVIFPSFIPIILKTILITNLCLLAYALFLSKSVIIALNLVYAVLIMFFAWSFGYTKELLLGTGKKWNYK